MHIIRDRADQLDNKDILKNLHGRRKGIGWVGQSPPRFWV